MTNKKFTIECEMPERWVPQFLGMLRYMQYLGNVGSSRSIRFYSDGDGDFRPKFSWPLELPVKEIKTRNGIIDASFDAG